MEEIIAPVDKKLIKAEHSDGRSKNPGCRHLYRKMRWLIYVALHHFYLSLCISM